MKGADGLAYTFRTLDKDPTRVLPIEWKDSIPAKIVQDQTSAAHPAGLIIVSSLAEAAGLPHTNPRLVYMPKDPQRWASFWRPSGTKPGRSTCIRSRGGRPPWIHGRYRDHLDRGSLEEASWTAGESRHDDSRLRASLRSVRRRLGPPFRTVALDENPGRDGYVPLAEDRDQAFANYSGTLMYFARTALPKFVGWRDDYENMKGLLIQGRDVDDWLLNACPAVRTSTRQAPPGAADGSSDRDRGHTMPPEWFAIDGTQFIADLKKRARFVV
jgi:hypothetical protein